MATCGQMPHLGVPSTAPLRQRVCTRFSPLSCWSGARLCCHLHRRALSVLRLRPASLLPPRCLLPLSLYCTAPPLLEAPPLKGVAQQRASTSSLSPVSTSLSPLPLLPRHSAITMQQLNTLHSPATATTTSHRATKHAPPPPSREEREEVERLLIREWALWAWICRVIGGEDEEDVMERSSAGLCGLLKDGERLCRLIVTLRPSVVSPATAHLPPILQHRARLRHFLNACTSFGIPPHHQYAPSIAGRLFCFFLFWFLFILPLALTSRLGEQVHC